MMVTVRVLKTFCWPSRCRQVGEVFDLPEGKVGQFVRLGFVDVVSGAPALETAAMEEETETMVHSTSPLAKKTKKT